MPPHSCLTMFPEHYFLVHPSVFPQASECHPSGSCDASCNARANTLLQQCCALPSPKNQGGGYVVPQGKGLPTPPPPSTALGGVTCTASAVCTAGAVVTPPPPHDLHGAHTGDPPPPRGGGLTLLTTALCPTPQPLCAPQDRGWGHPLSPACTVYPYTACGGGGAPPHAAVHLLVSAHRRMRRRWRRPPRCAPTCALLNRSRKG